MVFDDSDSGVGWVPCYESANEADARTVLALLQGRGFPCRLESLGGSVLPTMGFAVLVPGDRLEAAQELIESEPPEDAEAVPAFEPGVATPAPSVASGEVRSMDLARRAVRFVAEHPTILLTGVSRFVTAAVFGASAVPAAGTLEGLRTQLGPILLALAFETVVFGFALAFVDSALEGRASWPEAARRVTPPLGRLLAFEVVLGAPFFVPIWLGWLPETYPPALTALLVVGGVTYAYVLFRLFFVPMALIIDRTDVLEACRRSWALVGRAWPTIFGLLVLGAVVSLPFGLAPPADRIVEPLVGVVETVAFVLAYRMLSARATAYADTR